MSMQGCIAVEGEMQKLQELIVKRRDQGETDTEILRALEKEIEAVRKAAESGWL